MVKIMENPIKIWWFGGTTIFGHIHMKANNLSVFPTSWSPSTSAFTSVEESTSHSVFMAIMQDTHDPVFKQKTDRGGLPEKK